MSDTFSRVGPWRDEGNALAERYVRRRGLTTIACIARPRSGGPWEGWVQERLGERKPVTHSAGLPLDLVQTFTDASLALAGWTFDAERAA